jgi:hypothetical protein
VDLLPDVGDEVSAIVERAMSKDPDARFADARELERALVSAADRLLGTEASRRLGERARPVSWRKRYTYGRADSNALTLIGRVSTTPRPARSPLPRKKRNTSRVSSYALAAGAAFAAGAIGGAAIWLGRSSAAPSPRMVVVRAEPEVAVVEPEAPAVQEPSLEAAPVKPTAKAPARGAAAPQDTATELAESFRRQKGDVVLCVNEYPEAVERAPKLGVRFTLSADGGVVRAQVSPAEIAVTPLGTCIEQAARAMQVPKQSGAITFEVPLTARKGS